MDDIFRRIDEKTRLFVKRITSIKRSSIILLVAILASAVALLASVRIPNALLEIGSISILVVAFGMLSFSLYKRNDPDYGLSILENILSVVFPEFSEKLLFSLEYNWQEEIADKLQDTIIFVCIGFTIVSSVFAVSIWRAFHIQNSQMPPTSIVAPTPPPALSGTQSISPSNTVSISHTNSISTPTTAPILNGTQSVTPTSNIIVSPTNFTSFTNTHIAPSFAFTTNLQFDWDIEAAVPITLLISPNALVLKEYQILIDTITPRVAIAEAVFRGHPSFIDDEFVLLVNHGQQVDISSWSIVDDSNHRFVFPDVRLNTGSALFLHTGHGESSQYHQYWAMDNEIWSREPKITLFDSENAVIDIWPGVSLMSNSMFEETTD